MKYLLLIKYFFLSCLILILAGCVTTKHLIGERIQEDLSKQFDGVWEIKEEDESMLFFLKYLGNGELQFGGIDWETDKLKLETDTLILTKCGANKFMHWSDPEHAGKNVSDYIFLYFSFTTANEFKAWVPKGELFGKAITEGIILGEIDKIEEFSPIGKDLFLSIKINEPGKSLCDFIQTRNIEELFYLDDPAFTFHKIK